MQKKIFFFEIIASELVAWNCLYWEGNTCHRQSMCQIKLIRFCIWLRQTFCDSITFKMITKYGNGAVVQTATVFGLVYNVTCERVIWNGIFKTYILSPFGESVISKIHHLWEKTFLWKCSKFKVHFENAKKNGEKVFFFFL